MLVTDILGWIGNIGFISGSFLIARKRVEGFYTFALGNLLYIILGVLLRMTSLWAISCYLLIMNIYGIINWRKYEKKV